MKAQYNKIRLQLTLLTSESETDQEALTSNQMTEQEALRQAQDAAQARAELRGLQRQNISWWLAKEGGSNELQ